VDANVEQLPLTDVRDNPYESVFRKRHVNPPAPQCPGFVIYRSDAVAAGQGQEDFGFAFCPRLFQPVSPRRCVENRRVQHPVGRAAGQTILNTLLVGAPKACLTPAHHSSHPHLSSVTPEGTLLFRRAS
jgi:hypothetical protein